MKGENMKTKIFPIVTMACLLLSATAVLAQPTTNNKNVDTYSGVATVLVTGNKLDGPDHVEDWYNGQHYNCFRQASLSDKEVQQKLAHGWTEVAWPNPYPSDSGLITLRGPYICEINTISG
jgi:hypothetical protein